jgi:hypothetical protein
VHDDGEFETVFLEGLDQYPAYQETAQHKEDVDSVDEPESWEILEISPEQGIAVQ